MEELTVTRSIEQGIVVLRVDYSPELLLRRDASKRLGDEFVNQYESAIKEEGAATRSCVVEIKASTAGSPLVRALYDLYRKVYEDGGQVFCVGYPPDYISSLTALGLPSLAGFNLAREKAEAIQKLAIAARG
jgi:hypothetical protein